MRGARGRRKWDGCISGLGCGIYGGMHVDARTLVHRRREESPRGFENRGDCTWMEDGTMNKTMDAKVHEKGHGAERLNDLRMTRETIYHT